MSGGLLFYLFYSFSSLPLSLPLFLQALLRVSSAIGDHPRSPEPVLGQPRGVLFPITTVQSAVIDPKGKGGAKGGGKSSGNAGTSAGAGAGAGASGGDASDTGGDGSGEQWCVPLEFLLEQCLGEWLGPVLGPL